MIATPFVSLLRLPVHGWYTRPPTSKEIRGIEEIISSNPKTVNHSRQPAKTRGGLAASSGKAQHLCDK
jgi:hypothetical protein